MAKFDIFIDIGQVKKTLARVSFRNLPKIQQNFIILSFVNASTVAYRQSLFDGIISSNFWADLIDGVFSAIFGFTPAQQTKAQKDILDIVNKTKSITKTTDKGVLVEHTISDKVIEDITVTHTLRSRGETPKGELIFKGTPITFTWFKILMEGLQADHPIIQALLKVLPSVNVSRYTKDAVRGTFGNKDQNFFNSKSRSSLAIMVRFKPGKKGTIKDPSKYVFRIIPQGNILAQITTNNRQTFFKKLRDDFKKRLELINKK